MDYKFLRQHGALHDATAEEQTGASRSFRNVPSEVIDVIPAGVARENNVFPIAFDGETVTLLSLDPDDIALADKLRFILAKNVKLVRGFRVAITEAINQHYGKADGESVDSMLMEFTETAVDGTDIELSAGSQSGWGGLGQSVLGFKKGLVGYDSSSDFEVDEESCTLSEYIEPRPWGQGMFSYSVEEGQRVLMKRSNGTMQVIVGPKKVWSWGKTFTPMRHYIAYPGKFLILRYRDGRQEHLPGPAEVWFDPRIHAEISIEDALQLAAKEAVVVYRQPEAAEAITRRIVYGPALFVPEPGEWLHTFSWHASQGGHKGVQKTPNGLVFQKLWLMPDQMYHDVIDVRSADDAVLTIRLMIFFELTDIERMLETTHDPIGDFVNAATSDVVGFVGKYDFEAFKNNTHLLNEMEAYRQLTSRASQCGYRINKVVYRGYGAADALQQMHDEAIQSRTRLQLDRATEEQSQDLENYRLQSQLARASQRRTEQTSEVEHDLELQQKRQDAELHRRESVDSFARDRLRQESELQLSIRRNQHSELREHLAALHEMGVDLTAYLTQARADRVIELRGDARTHLHLDSLENEAKAARESENGA